MKATATIASLIFAATTAQPAWAADFAPYGTAKVDMHPMDATNVVLMLNYENPQSLNTLYNFVKNTKKETKGKVVVVTHGPELRAFAKENYEKYQGIVDKMAETAKDGVEFKMCNNAMRAAGFKAEDMHGMITVVPRIPGTGLLAREGISVYQSASPASKRCALYRSARFEAMRVTGSCEGGGPFFAISERPTEFRK